MKDLLEVNASAFVFVVSINVSVIAEIDLLPNHFFRRIVLKILGISV